MNIQLVSFIYAAVLHVAALISLVVLVALGKLSWVEAGPIIGGLVGVGVGVPLTVAALKPPDPPPATPVAPPPV